MISIMINYSLDFLRTVATFLTSDVALVFVALIFLVMITGAVKTLIS